MAQIDRLGIITVVLKDGQSLVREFVVADDANLVVLNLTDETLPREVPRTLRSLASSDAMSFLGLPQGRTLAKGKVRVDAGGVFLQDRRVADLAQVIDVFPREAVLEIVGPVVAGGSVGGAIAGGFFGFFIGLGVGEAAGGNAAASFGTMALFAFWGAHGGTHHVDGLVYRAQ